MVGLSLCTKLSISSIEISDLVHSGNSSAYIATAQMTCLLVHQVFFASMINYSSSEFNRCLKLHYTQAPHKAMQDIPFSVELYFCATVSLQLEHVLGRGTFGLRQYRLAAAFSCGRWHHCQWTVFLRTLQFFLGPNILHEWQIVYWSVSVQTNHFFRKSSAVMMFSYSTVLILLNELLD